ncbi:hypothetical protein LXL04_023522 [Taraxacum kok-saghyz]
MAGKHSEPSATVGLLKTGEFDHHLGIKTYHSTPLTPATKPRPRARPDDAGIGPDAVTATAAIHHLQIALDFEQIGRNHVEIGGETKPEIAFEDPGRFGRTPSVRPNAYSALVRVARATSPSRKAGPTSELKIYYRWFECEECASSLEEVVIDTDVVVDSEWELSEGTCSEGKEILDLQPRFGLASLGIGGNLGVDGFETITYFGAGGTSEGFRSFSSFGSCKCQVVAHHKNRIVIRIKDSTLELVKFGRYRFVSQVRKNDDRSQVRRNDDRSQVRKSDSESVGSQGQLRMQPSEVLRTSNDADANPEAVRSLANLRSWTVARLNYIVLALGNISFLSLGNLSSSLSLHSSPRATSGHHCRRRRPPCRRRGRRRKIKPGLQIKIGQWGYVHLDSPIKTPKLILANTGLDGRKTLRTVGHRRPPQNRRIRPPPWNQNIPLDSPHSRDQTPTKSKAGRRPNRARRRHSHRRDPPPSNRALDFEQIGRNHVEIGGETKPEIAFEDPGRFGRTPSVRPNAYSALVRVARATSPSRKAGPTSELKIYHHLKFAKLRTASKFASASFEVRKASDGCIRNCLCEPTLSESEFRTHTSGHLFANLTSVIIFPNLTSVVNFSEPDLRTYTFRTRPASLIDFVVSALYPSLSVQQLSIYMIQGCRNFGSPSKYHLLRSWYSFPKPSTPRLPQIPRLANPNLGCKSKIFLPSERVPSESSHSESTTTFVSITTTRTDLVDTRARSTDVERRIAGLPSQTDATNTLALLAEGRSVETL